jgi:hypothetical protein
LSPLSANMPSEIHTVSIGKQFRCHSMLINQGLSIYISTVTKVAKDWSSTHTSI